MILHVLELVFQTSHSYTKKRVLSFYITEHWSSLSAIETWILSSLFNVLDALGII